MKISLLGGYAAFVAKLLEASYADRHDDSDRPGMDEHRKK